MEDLKDYIDNTLFIKWVFEPDDHIREYWDYYIIRHPDEQEKLFELKSELELFKISNRELTEERKQYLLNEIKGKVINRQKVTRFVTTGRSIMKYAAFAILFISIGAAISYLYQRENSINEFSKLLEVPQISNKPTILLSNGAVINVGTKESEVVYTSANQLVINNDSIIKLPETKEEGGISTILQSIPYGCRSKIVLSDKSIIWLNAGSRLIYPSTFTGKEREVTLVGEAFFEVEKDEKKPFIVHTPDYSIKVLGTKFNVSSYASDDASQTVLTEGRVELKLNNSGWLDEDIVLKPNEMFAYNKISKESKVRVVDPDKYICWIDGVIKCDNVELRNVTRKLERFYDIQIEISNPQDGSIKIDGKLNLKENKKEVLYYLTKVAKRRYTEKNDWYYVIE